MVAALQSVAARVASAPDLSGLPEGPAGRLGRLATAASAQDLLLSVADDTATSLALLDVHELNALLTRLAAEPTAVPVAVALIERVEGHIGRALLAASAEPQKTTEDAADQAAGAGRDYALDELARAYRDDAARERAGAGWCSAVAVLSFLSAVAAAIWAVAVADGPARAGRGLPGPLLVCGGAVLAALLLLRTAAARQRAAREYTRLERGVQGLGPYLAPLPAPARHLLRATMAQTLFPRLLDDDDPLRQPVWPEANALLHTIYGYVPGLQSAPEPDDD